MAALPTTVELQERRAARTSNLVVVTVWSVAACSFLFSQLVTPHDSLLAVVMVALGIGWVAAYPAVGIYIVIAFSLLGDIAIAPWYPFGKNFSSAESILFVSDSMIMNLAEVFLLATTVSWLLRRMADPTWTFRRGRLLAPLLAFTTFVVLGLVNGLIRGGNMNIGLWEVRPLLYLPLLYVLVTNLFASADQYRRAMWVAMTAITGHSLLALKWYFELSSEARATLRSLGEHAASVHANALIVFLLALLLLRNCSPVARIALPFMAVPVLWVYMLAQRRAAVVALSLGSLLLAAVLFQVSRRAFWWYVPTLLLVSVAYLGAFWNVEQGIGFPAQAIKAAVAPNSVSTADQGSADYRDTEAINLWFTIRASPLRGLGFGHAFYVPYPLPDISFFPFWNFMPHHSLLWIWLKMGFPGFVTMFFLMARTIQYGARSVVRLSGDAQAVALTAVLYVVMYVVFAYADIAWDLRSMVFLAFCMAVAADMVDAGHRTGDGGLRVATPSLVGGAPS